MSQYPPNAQNGSSIPRTSGPGSRAEASGILLVTELSLGEACQARRHWSASLSRKVWFTQFRTILIEPETVYIGEDGEVSACEIFESSSKLIAITQ